MNDINDNIKERIFGLFFGQLIGDALGTRYEFMGSIHATNLLKKDIETTVSSELEILGGGPFKLKPGQYTDDSELALGVWYSILKNNEYNIENIANIFLDWYSSDPFDIGRATKLAFGNIHNNKNVAGKIKTNSVNYNMFSLSNGCLMKISPLGGINILLDKQYDLIFLANEFCALTNPNPTCQDMSVCYVGAIDVALRTGNPNLAYTKACELATQSVTKQILELAKKQTSPTISYNEKMQQVIIQSDQTQQGYIGIAFQNAFYNLLNVIPSSEKPKDGFLKIMTNTICLGGDVDTNACIAGALYGACYGYKYIKPEWLSTVMNFKSDESRIKCYEPLNHQKVLEMLMETVKNRRNKKT